jgi:hypothetical protein
MPAAQKLWHVPKPHRLELLEEGFWRRAVGQASPVAALETRYAPAMAWILMPIFEVKAAIGPRPELPWQVQPEEERVMMALVAEVTVLEMRHIAEPEHEVAVAELEYQPRPPEVPEVPPLEVWGMPELQCKTRVVEVSKAP